MLCLRYNRFDFVRIAEDMLRRHDMLFISDFYARTPSSGFFFYTYNSKFVGLIAIDASVPGADWQPGQVHTRSQRQRAKDISTAASLRHFYVVEKYRKALVQDDLLQHAIRTAFEGSWTVERIGAMPPVLSPYIDEALKKHGFVVKGQGEKLGILGWRQSIYELTRENWEKSQKE